MSDTYQTEELPGDYALDDSDEPSVMATSGLANFVYNKYNSAKTNRRELEEAWHEAHVNFRGKATETTKFTSTEESQVVIKVTKTKVVAAYGIVHEILFPNYGNTFPVMVKPTPVPEGVEDAVHIDPKAPPKQQNDAGGGININLGPLASKLQPVKDDIRKGTGVTPGSLTFSPATDAAAYMDRKMQDQFYEGGAHAALRKAVFDSILYGTGIMKGPFAVEKEYPYWDTTSGSKPRYAPRKKMIPSWEHISIWDFYTDPETETEEDMEWCVVRRRYNRSQLRNLRKRKSFRKDAIDRALEAGPAYEDDWWEGDLDETNLRTSTNRFDVLEFWGTIDVEEFEEEISNDFELPEELEDADELSVSIWVCNGEVLKFSINAYRPQKIPFHVFRYEYNPSSFYGIGLAENMADTQLLMNGFMRMAIDNAAKSGNLIFEVDEDNLVPGQDIENLYPGKIIRRQGGAPGQAMFATKYQNTTQENMAMYDKARQLADESTGFPSFAHGQTGVSGVGRTASGISMLMGAASTQMKTVIKNYDNALEQVGASLFTFNMTFDYDERAVGDVTIVSRGTEGLMANEIRMQRLAMFAQQAANPIMAPYVKWPYMLREIAKTLDLDPDKMLNSPEEAMLQALQIQKMGGAGGGPGTPPGAQSVPGSSPTDTQGAGGPGIPGVGMPQVPGSPGFTGTPGGNGGQG